MNPLPKLLKPNFDRIPNELRAAPQWVNWSATWQPEKAKYNKPPINPRTLAFAKSTDPSTWASFETACQTYERNQSRLAGIGYVLTAGAGLVGIDIDHCIEEGRIEARAQAIIDRFASYTELSPSGKGIRIFIKGRLSGGGRKVGNVEIYDRDRYLTLTGHALGEPRPIRSRQLEIDSLYEELSAPRPRPALVPFVPSAGDFDMRNYARGIEGYRESSGFGRAKCPAHQGEGSTSFHVNLSTGAYGCFSGCTTEAIRAAIGHPKPEPLQAKAHNGAPPEPPVTITDVRAWGPEERKRHLDRFRSASAAQNAMNDMLLRAVTLAGYSNLASRMITSILACVGQCEDGEICYRSRLAIARHLKLKGTDENNKYRVSKLLVALKREFAKSGRKPLTIISGNPKQSPGFVIHTFKLVEMADAMRRNHPKWQFSRYARYEATDAAALWLLEQWPEAEPIPDTAESNPLGPREYGDRTLEEFDRFYDSRIAHLEELTFEDEVQFYEEKMLEHLQARIASRRKTLQARTALLDTPEEEPLLAKKGNSLIGVKEVLPFSANMSPAEEGKNGNSMLAKKANITVLNPFADNTNFSNCADVDNLHPDPDLELSELAWEASDEANT